MNKLKLLIAENSEEFRSGLADALQCSYQVSCCAEGNRAKQLLEEIQPDLVVLDLLLPGMDGISLLRWMAAAEIMPRVLVVTSFANSYVLSQLELLNVGYVLLKPCSVGAVCTHLHALSESLQSRIVSRTDPRTQVSNLLLSLGIPTRLRGYAYLREAVLLRMEDPAQSITKELYPEVARICGCAPGHVERSIRTALEAAWEQRDEALWKLYFPAGGREPQVRPSNGAFISRLAESLIRQMQQISA